MKGIFGHQAGEPSANVGRTFPPEPLTRAEVEQLLKACSIRAPTGVRNRALIVVMWRCGLRISEALALKPSDYDAEQGTIRVLHGKGDKARTVRIDPGAAAAVDRWLERRRQLVPRKGWPLFCTLTGEPLMSQYVRHMLHHAAERAGIEKRVAPHQFRHTFAVELTREGRPVWEIQQLLGHASLDGTAHYLAGLDPGTAGDYIRTRVWEEPS
jgi:site-specific recombinase XerD